MATASSPLTSPHKRKNEDEGSTPLKRAKPIGNDITSFFKPASSAPTPSSKPGAGEAASGGVDIEASATRVPFDKATWTQSNWTQEQRDLLKLEIETLDESWFAELKDYLTTPSFLSLKKFLQDEKRAGKTIFPPEESIYSWSQHTPLHKVKVVILGQDPYHDTNQAHGLSFSVKPPRTAPPSLLNIYKALKIDYPQFCPPPNRAGDLTRWADQGVLLLNTCLTVRAHQAFSHSKKGWEEFTQRVLQVIGRKRKGQPRGGGVVFLAWGAAAQKRCDELKDVLKKEEGKAGADRHLVLKSAHPSPLSASRGFFTCGHFKSANEWLASRYGPYGVIDWSLVPGQPKCGPPEDGDGATDSQTEPVSAENKDFTQLHGDCVTKDEKKEREMAQGNETLATETTVDTTKTEIPKGEQLPYTAKEKGKEGEEDYEAALGEDDSEIMALVNGG